MYRRNSQEGQLGHFLPDWVSGEMRVRGGGEGEEREKAGAVSAQQAFFAQNRIEEQ